MFVGKITVTTYTCRYGPVSLYLSVVVSQTTRLRDIPHRRGSGSGTGPLESVSRGPHRRGTGPGDSAFRSGGHGLESVLHHAEATV